MRQFFCLAIVSLMLFGNDTNTRRREFRYVSKIQARYLQTRSYTRPSAPRKPQTYVENPACRGEFSVITYNVAGLPQLVSKVRPSINTPLIGRQLANVELLLVQEDFSYHHDLDWQMRQAFQSDPLSRWGPPFSDGLNRFSEMPFYDFVRVPWAVAHGVLRYANDELAPKGFSAARHLLPSGDPIVVINWHADAGRAEGDIQTRVKQLNQLAEFMDQYCGDFPVIVAGDSNLKRGYPHDEKALQQFCEQTRLQQSCQILNAPGCLDRVLFRRGKRIDLRATSYRRMTHLISTKGEPLSDHTAIRVSFDWWRVRRK